MIPARGDYVVIFTNRGPIGHYPVEAWDEQGRPMIVGTKGLVVATHVHPDWTCEPDIGSRPIALIPVHGPWLVEFRHRNDPDATWTEPVVGWAVTRDGGIDPIVVDHEEGPRPLTQMLEASSAGLSYDVRPG